MLPRALCLGLVAAVTLAPSARAADSETRTFAIFVDGKPAGDMHLTIQRTDDSTFTVSTATVVAVQILLVKYNFNSQGKEVWKEGRFVRFEGSCNDDGKRTMVTATADQAGIRVRVNNSERIVPADTRLTTYWAMPDPKVLDKPAAYLDTDSGRDLEGTLKYLGPAQLTLGAQTLETHHYQLNGKHTIDLWYDAAGRLVRQQRIENTHRVVIEMSGRR